MPPPADEHLRYPLGRRVLDTIRAPGRLSSHFRTWTPWKGPIVVAVAIGIAAVLLVPQQLYVAQAGAALRDASAGVPAPTAESLAANARLLGAVGVAFGTPVMAFAVAGVLALVFSVLGRGEARYLQYLAVTSHALVIAALGSLAAVPVQVARGDPDARLSLGLLLPALDAGSLPQRVLLGIEPFTLWTVLVLALGVSGVNRGLTRTRAAAVLLALYLLALGGAAAAAG